MFTIEAVYSCSIQFLKYFFPVEIYWTGIFPMLIYRRIFIAYFYSALVCVHQPFLCLLLNRHAPALIYGLDPFAKSTE